MLRVFVSCLVLLCLSIGCLRNNPREVIAYASLDKEFSEPLLEEFGKQTGIKVLSKYDVESNKTVGLANEIIAHANRPRGDLFWNNEILHTIRLEKLGLLENYHSPFAEKYPPQFVSKEGSWYGFAARARVLIINRQLLPEQSDWPASVAELADPRWKGKCGMARPLFGTTATHAAVLFAQLGDQAATDFFEQVAANAVVESGNKQVAQHVAEGRYAWGVTDTDDAVIEIEAGKDVALVFPDQRNQGTLLIPNTLAIIKGGPNTDSARKLVDWLLRSETELQLARGASAQIPLNREVMERSRVAPQDLKVMKVDFVAAAEKWETAQAVLVEIFR